MAEIEIGGDALYFGAVVMLRKHCSAAGGVSSNSQSILSLLGVHVDYTAEVVMHILVIS